MRNLDTPGRLVRGLGVLVLLIGAGFGFAISSWLKFQVLTPAPIVLHPTTLMDYGITVPGLPIRWHTEAAQWRPPHRFVDEQIRGPYRQWIRARTFEGGNGGTVVPDLFPCAVLGGWLVNALLSRRDVHGIPRFCQDRLRTIFP